LKSSRKACSPGIAELAKVLLNNYNQYFFSADPWRACPGSGDAGVRSLRRTPKYLFYKKIQYKDWSLIILVK